MSSGIVWDRCRDALLWAALAILATGSTSAAESPKVASAAPGSGDIPATFVQPEGQKDYVKRVEMIPMRDGVRLYTVIIIPKGASGAPIVLTRTPYNAAQRAERNRSDRMQSLLPLADEPFVAAGFIRVYQDVRGKYGSEGVYEMTRPVVGPLNPTHTDHTTDAWDTIDWLVKNLHESNGKVAMIGSSYEGFTVVMALLHPHPALKAAVPESPMVDGWMGDDWFHYGAFRQTNFDYLAAQTEQKGEGRGVPRAGYDDFQTLLKAGSAGNFATGNGLDQLGWWRKMTTHPAYDAFWRDQALDALLVEHPSTVPTLWEQGLWDQEDMWGANHSFLALKAAGREATNWLVMGPWFHSQVNREGWSLGPFKWSGDTALQFRREMVLPFLRQYLMDGPPADLARATIYNTAENHWDHFNDWPSACAAGCPRALTPLFLEPDLALGFDKPTGTAGPGGQDSYVSDPAKPVPYLPRPVRFSDTDGWRTWLVRDQRFVDGRPDVLTYQTLPLTQPIKIQGAPVADIVAATTGTDGDFVVKLIDVYPEDYPSQPELGGYELSLAMDIFRGRYRESPSQPTPIPANVPQHYRFTLPNSDHVFLPGHRIMVQIQSSWFPLYDRNPQTFVDNIFLAPSTAYQAATVSILHTSEQSSAVWLPIAP